MPEPIIPQTDTTNHAQDYWKVVPQKCHNLEPNIEEEHWRLASFKGEAVFLDVKIFEMIMMVVEGFSFSKAASEFGCTKSQLRKKLLKLKLKHIQNTKVSVDILADSNLK